MLGAFLFQNIYGMVLDRFPAPDGAYSTEGHRAGTGIMIVFLLMALAWSLVSPHLGKAQLETEA
jgi:hypothetical protein